MKLRNNIEKLMTSTEMVLELLKTGLQEDQSQLAHAAKYQGMLAIRMASLHLLKAWGIQDDDYVQDFQTAMDQFQYTLEELEVEEKNTPQIKLGLKEVRKRFSRLEKGTQAGTSQFILGMVAHSADKLLDRTERIAHLYQAELQHRVTSDNR